MLILRGFVYQQNVSHTVMFATLSLYASNLILSSKLLIYFVYKQGQGGGQVQVNPQTGQPDYSVQWVEYYRSLGMHREAEMIEQQAKANKVCTKVNLSCYYFLKQIVEI